MHEGAPFRSLDLGDPSAQGPVYYAVASTLCVSGEFGTSSEPFERAAALCHPGYHRSHVQSFGVDFGVLTRAVAAHALWHLGYPARALEWSRQGLELADGLAHPFSRAIALAYDAMLQQFLGDPEAVAERAAAVVDLSRKEGFPYYHAWGTILEGWVLAERGDVERGLSVMRDGLAAMRATGAEARRPYYLALQAEQCGKAGRVKEGLALLEEGLTFADATGAHFKTAELHRLRGELLLASGGDEPNERAVEASFRQARDIARRQEARMLELRATVSLARLLQRQRRHGEARQMLGEIAAWFTEGFDTADLRCAKVLIADLS